MSQVRVSLGFFLSADSFRTKHKMCRGGRTNDSTGPISKLGPSALRDAQPPRYEPVLSLRDLSFPTEAECNMLGYSRLTR